MAERPSLVPEVVLKAFLRYRLALIERMLIRIASNGASLSLVSFFLLIKVDLKNSLGFGIVLWSKAFRLLLFAFVVDLCV